LRVRSALVSLHPDGPTYEAAASGWEGRAGRTPLLSVPWGRPTGDGGAAATGGAAGSSSLASSSSVAPSPSAAAAASAAAQIVPLGRASGSRVSRILEGSMDVP
jgi:hypothetical protein